MSKIAGGRLLWLDLRDQARRPIETPIVISRPSADLPQQIIRARKTFHLSLAQMAAELRIRPEWLSKISNGHQPASYNVGLRFDDFLRRRGVDPLAFARGVDAEVSNTAAQYGPAETLRSKIDQHYRLLVEAAGNDLTRLVWIASQMRDLVATEHHGEQQATKPTEQKRRIATASQKTPRATKVQATAPVTRQMASDDRRQLLVQRLSELALKRRGNLASKA